MADNHPTEAACLLEQGASYHRRIGLEERASQGDPIFAGFKTGAFSLYFGDAPIYHFDLEGRWQRAFVNGTHYLKGLDASVQAIDRVREGANLTLKRRNLSYAETSDFDAVVRTTAIDLCARLDAERLDRVEPKSPKARTVESDELRDFLDRISRWDTAAWFAHRERYLSAYGPLPLLPPECQGAVVVQATLGHATGVAFGGGPASEPYTRSVTEFEGHAKDVARLWGRRLSQSRIVFLAGADVLHQPGEEVAGYLSAVGSTFPIESQNRERDRRWRTCRKSHTSTASTHFWITFRSPCPTGSAGMNLRRGDWSGSVSESSQATRTFSVCIKNAGTMKCSARLLPTSRPRQWA